VRRFRTIFTALIIRMSGGSITYGGSDTISNSRGAELCGEGSGGLIGNDERGAKKACSRYGRHHGRQTDRQADSFNLNRFMVVLISVWPSNLPDLGTGARPLQTQ